MGSQCNSEKDYSLTKCLSKYVSSSVGCRMFWNNHSSLKLCFSKADIVKTQNTLEWIKSSHIKNISRISGCYLKCTETKYEVTVLSEEQLSWARNWISDVYIQAESDSEEVSHEYYAYDSGALIGDLGGYLGLFLGWSFLSIFSSLPRIWNFLVTKTLKMLKI